MTHYVGTIGFGYKQWVGNFYPPKMKAEKMLAFYGRYFNSAELDSTFYGTPPIERVQKWRDACTSGFMLSPKTPRDISHAHDLRTQIGAMIHFVETVGALDEHLGAILIQLPPSKTAGSLVELQEFVRSLPRGFRYAIEFRDASWQNDQTIGLLKEQNVAWVCADYIHLSPEVIVTADFAYFRWLGRHGAYSTKDREITDQSERLSQWFEKSKPYLGQLDTTYGYFNNDFSGHSPATANRWKKLLGLDFDYPKHLTQQSLF